MKNLILAALLALISLPAFGQSSQTGSTWGDAGTLNPVTGYAPILNTTTQSVTSSATLVNATGLTARLVGGKTYLFKIHLPHTGGTSGGFKAGLAASGLTATNIWYCGTNYVSAGTAPLTTCVAPGTSFATAVCGVTADALGDCEIIGGLVANAGGTLSAQFAQNSTNGTATVLQFPSSMEIIPLN